MRTLPAALATELAGVTSSACHLIEVQKRGTGRARYAVHQSNLVVGGVTYYAARGLRVSPIVSEANATLSTVDLEIALLDATGIDPDEIRNGAWDFANVIISVASHANPGAGLARLWKGYLGQVELTDRGMAKVQGVGLLAKAREIPIEHYTPTCRVDFGSTRCQKALAPLKLSTTITSVSGFNVGLGVSPGATFKLGLLVPTTGASVGDAFEIRDITGSTAKMYLPPRGRIAVGDAVDLYPGCDKTLDGAQGCKFWNNVVNFQGEFHVPGADALSINYSDWGA